VNNITLETMFSSKSVEMSTPLSFFNKLDEIFKFTLDPCATKNNNKCDIFFTINDNGLKQSWEGHTVFMNPPYGRAIGEWIKKAYEESTKPNTTVVCLLPARTDTKWWHDYCMRADEVHFVKGRLKFGGCENAAPFPSAVVVFSNKCIPKIKSIERE